VSTEEPCESACGITETIWRRASLGKSLRSLDAQARPIPRRIIDSIAAIIVGLLLFWARRLTPNRAGGLVELRSRTSCPRTLQNWWIPRGFSVTSLSFCSPFWRCLPLAVEATHLAGDLPRYKSTIDAKISSFRTTVATGGPLARAAAMLEDFGREISKPVAEGMNALSKTQSPEQAKEPVPVEVRQAPVGPFERLSEKTRFI
jgi:hypothetical protein